MTYAEYCAAERSATSKHEYLRGEVFAMVGGTLEHGRLGARVIHLLSSKLSDRPCTVFSSDVRVRVEATDLDTYPDASVVCGEPRTSAQDHHVLLDPTCAPRPVDPVGSRLDIPPLEVSVSVDDVYAG